MRRGSPGSVGDDCAESDDDSQLTYGRDPAEDKARLHGKVVVKLSKISARNFRVSLALSSIEMGMGRGGGIGRRMVSLQCASCSRRAGFEPVNVTTLNCTVVSICVVQIHTRDPLSKRW